MRRLMTMALMIAVAGLAGLARADDKPNPTGTWKWSVERNGQTFDQTLKLKLEGDKLTGTLSRGEMETKIDDAKYKDGELSFTVTQSLTGTNSPSSTKAK